MPKRNLLSCVILSLINIVSKGKHDRIKKFKDKIKTNWSAQLSTITLHNKLKFAVDIDGYNFSQPFWKAKLNVGNYYYRGSMTLKFF